MEINGKEFGMAYTVGAHVRWNSYIVSHQQSAFAEAQFEKALIMHDEWCRINKVPDGKKVTKAELLAQPFRVFEEITQLCDAQVKADGEQTVELEGKKE